MTRERLEELITQGGEVYDKVKDKLIKLNKKTCHLVMSYPSKDIDMLEIKYKIGKYECHYVDHYIANLTDDTNDIERAKNEIERLNWERKTHAERIERFEPPMWEDLFKDIYWFEFLVAENKPNGNYKHILFNANQYHKIEIIANNKPTFRAELTKENYEKACEIVRDLFKGGVK